MDIYYIYHSCFVVEDEEYILIFDYYKVPRKKNYAFSMEDFTDRKDKKIVVFSSHNHSDHFNPEILKWEKKNLTYVLSSDIELEKYPEKSVVMKEEDEAEVEGLKIKAYGSTDAGISFWIKMKDRVIFHAGDLNWWAWLDDTKEEEEFMRTTFQRIVGEIKENNEKIDIAFFPVDPRLEVNAFMGGEYFVKEIAPKEIIPMHFGKSYDVVNDFVNLISNGETKGIKINDTMEKLIV